MQQLQFPSYEFRFKNRENKLLIFDIVRKKFVILTPEEWVRQHAVHYLHHQGGIPLSMINVEKQIQLHSIIKRFDIAVFYPTGELFLIVECKAPEIPISQDSFDQVARYNMTLHARYLMVTNGMHHYYCMIDKQQQQYSFLESLPEYHIK